MTGVVIIRGIDTMFMLTDGVGYDREGIVRRIERKVDHLRCGTGVVFCRGQVAVTFPIIDNIRAAEDTLPWMNFDKLADVLAIVGHDTQKGCEEDVGRHLECEIWLAGWSLRNEHMEVHLWMGGDHGGEFIERGKTHKVGAPFAFSPDPLEAEARALWGLGEDGDLQPLMEKHIHDNGFDPRRDGLMFMELQRRNVTKEGDEREHLPPGTSTVGGHCMLTQITRDGCHDELLWTWPDRIGERIEVDGPGGVH